MNVRKLLRCRFLFVFVFATLAQGQAPAPYQVAATKNIGVPMRDGVKLATDVYRPSRNGAVVSEKFSSLLVRTPYDRSGYEGYYAAIFVPHGYIVVIQSVRAGMAPRGAGDSSVTILATDMTPPRGSRRSHGATAPSARSADPMRAARNMPWQSPILRP